MKSSIKLSEYALNYISNHIMAAVHDCSDSMKDEEKYKNKFDALADDKFDIHDYIEKYHLDDYVKKLKKIATEYDTVENWEEYLTNTPGCLTFSYEKIKHLL